MPTYFARMRVSYEEDWFVEADTVIEAKEKLLAVDLAGTSPPIRLSWAYKGPIYIAKPVTDNDEETKDDLI